MPSAWRAAGLAGILALLAACQPGPPGDEDRKPGAKPPRGASAPAGKGRGGHAGIRIVRSDVPAGTTKRLRRRISDERRRVRKYWGAGFSGPVRVEISKKFKVARALVPAWHGDRGHLELPSRTVRAGTTPTLHELVHIEAPNASRFLAEGLAVYLQTRLNGEPAFPNFARDLHYETHRVAAVRGIVKLDRVATPAPLTGDSGLSRRQAYLVAGSFVRFLIETHGRKKFRRLYGLTPFRPGHRAAIEPGRYRRVYGAGLQELADGWRRWLSW